jgi:serine protease Do
MSATGANGCWRPGRLRPGRSEAQEMPGLLERMRRTGVPAVVLAVVCAWGAMAQAPAPAAHPGSYLGIGVRELAAQRAEALGVPGGRGVEVSVVVTGTPADRAGLKMGDVVLQFNGQPVEGVEPFMRMVRNASPGRPARLLVWRDGASKTVSVVLGARQPGMPKFVAAPPAPPGDAMASNPLFEEFPGWVPMGGAGLLGIEVETLTPQLAEYFGVKAGVLVRSVRRGGVADRAGMKAGDVIVKIEDTTVATTGDLLDAEATAHAGGSCSITVSRDHKPRTITAILDGDTQRVTPVRLHER